jgi:hypothetical protein
VRPVLHSETYRGGWRSVVSAGHRPRIDPASLTCTSDGVSLRPPPIKPRRVTAGEHARELFCERVASWWGGYRRNFTGSDLLIIWALSLLVAHVCWTRGAPDTESFPLVAFLLFVGAPSFAVVSTFLWLGRPSGPSGQADAASAPDLPPGS